MTKNDLQDAIIDAGGTYRSADTKADLEEILTFGPVQCPTVEIPLTREAIDSLYLAGTP